MYTYICVKSLCDFQGQGESGEVAKRAEKILVIVGLLMS